MTGLAAFMLGACGGADEQEAEADTAGDAPGTISVSAAELAGNPFLEAWDTPFGVPPFDSIDNAHYMPAFKQGILDQRAEIEAIVDNAEAPTFANTIVALEAAGELLTKVNFTFGNITNTELDDELRTLEIEINPMLTRENDAILMNPDLWARIRTVYE